MKTVFVWIVVCFIWSTMWLFIKLGLRDLPPVSFAGLRLLIAVLVLLPVVIVRRVSLPRGARDSALIVVTGLLLLGVNYGLLFWGTQHISSGLAAVLQAATPAFGLVFANSLLPRERFTFAKLCAVGLGVAGVCVIFSDRLSAGGWSALTGSAAVTGGALCVALAYVLVKAYGSHLKPTTLVVGQMLSSVFPLLIVGFAIEGSPLSFRWTWTGAGSLLYVALAGSVAAFWLNYWLLARMEATKVMSMSLVIPLFAVLLGAIVLGEELTMRTLAGGACIVASVGLVLARKSADERRADV